MDKLFSGEDRARMEWLCTGTRMPDEVTRQILALPLAAPAGVDVAASRLGLTRPTEAEAAWRALQEQLKDIPDSWLWHLGIQLAAALTLWDGLYREQGMGETVFLDTMGCFSRFVREHKASFGVYGFDRDFWSWRQTCGREYRLGALEFEMLWQSPAPVAEQVGRDGPVLSVHIPSDAGLSRSELDASYREASAFFALHWPKYHYTATYCDTWLLSPKLAEWLKPGSGILNFAADYLLLKTDADSDSGVSWLFGRPAGAVPTEELDEDTSLRRAAKRCMLAGGHIGSALGIVERGGRQMAAGCAPFSL